MIDFSNLLFDWWISLIYQLMDGIFRSTSWLMDFSDLLVDWWIFLIYRLIDGFFWYTGWMIDFSKLLVDWWISPVYRLTDGIFRSTGWLIDFSNLPGYGWNFPIYWLIDGILNLLVDLFIACLVYIVFFLSKVNWLTGICVYSGFVYESKLVSFVGERYKIGKLELPYFTAWCTGTDSIYLSITETITSY